jgi:putative ABC transport system permease protein
MSFAVLVSTSDDPLGAAADLRAAIRDTDRRISVAQPTSLDAILGEQLAARRLTSDLTGGFAVAALAVAALGMYGLLAVLVGSRTREIGVRLAIGASPISVAKQVLGESLRNALAGIALGCVLAISSGELLRGLLVGVSGRDPLTLVVVAATLLTLASAAAAIPALRAARVDPVEALRAEQV